MSDSRPNKRARASALRLVSSRTKSHDATSLTSEDNADDLERELAADRREMRRSLAAKLTNEHGAPLWDGGHHNVGTHRRDASVSPQLFHDASAKSHETEVGPDDLRTGTSHTPLIAAAAAGCALSLAYLTSEFAFLDGATTTATDRILRSLITLPIIWAAAVGVAMMVQSMLDRRRSRGSLDDPSQFALELELALERRQMRRALAAKMLDDYRRNPGTVPSQALRAALSERDRADEECEALDRALIDRPRELIKVRCDSPRQGR